MSVSIELQEKVTNKINEVLRIAKDKFGYNKEFPVVHYDVRGVCAGKAWYTVNKIGFNAVLLNENTDTFIDRTVVHEVAHLVAYDVFKATGHGLGWKRVMEVFGATANRCHNYDVTNARTRQTYTYECNCRQHQLTSTRHNKITKYGAKYWCNHCDGQLKRVVKKQTVTSNVAPILIAASNVGTPTSTKLSNKEQVKQLIESNPTSTKQELIDLIINLLNVTKSNASVYLYNYYKAK